MEIFQKIAARNNLSINITVTTTDVELARLLEPRAPRPDLRLDAVRRFNDARLSAGVAIAPVLPGITDSPKSLDAVVKAAAEAKAQWIFANPLFLKPCSEKVFMPFLAEKFPELLKSYQERYAKNAHLPAAYKKQISTLVKKLKTKYGIAEMRTVSSSTPPQEPTQQQAFPLPVGCGYTRAHASALLGHSNRSSLQHLRLRRQPFRRKQLDLKEQQLEQLWAEYWRTQYATDSGEQKDASVQPVRTKINAVLLDETFVKTLRAAHFSDPYCNGVGNSSLRMATTHASMAIRSW